MGTAPYLYHPTGHFRSRLEKIRASDPPGYKRISRVIARLLENPDDADGRMHGLHQGRFKKYVGRRNYRLIYYYCELCRKANRRMNDTCENCESISDRSVVFFEVYHKNEGVKPGV